jgi:ATP-dependent Lon protease
MSYVRTRAERFGIDKKFSEICDVHVHVPEGAIPKDGPSAGITMATTIISALTRIPVRKDVAMTGEITLRGRVLAIGGLKEKAMAAHRGGIKTILIPIENKKDIKEIPKRVREAMTIIPVEHMDEVLRHALVLADPDAFFRHAEEVALREETDRKKPPPATPPASPPPAPQTATL